LLSKNIELKIYGSVILPVVFIWVCHLVCHTEGRTEAGACEKRMLRKIFGPKREEVTRGWRKLNSVEHHDLYS
jgi:hypothetical protein